MAQQAHAHLPPEEHFQVSPHVLRHTLLRNVAHENGVHDVMELSGHQSDRGIWREVRPEAQSLAEAIDEGDAPTTVHTRPPEGCGPCRAAVHLGKRGASGYIEQDRGESGTPAARSGEGHRG
jgi:hypothetical protein